MINDHFQHSRGMMLLFSSLGCLSSMAGKQGAPVGVEGGLRWGAC